MTSTSYLGGSSAANKLAAKATHDILDRPLSPGVTVGKVAIIHSEPFFANVHINVTITPRSSLSAQARQQVLHEPIVLLAGITVGNFAFWADSLLVAVLLHYGASSFKRVAEVKCDNQLPFIFQVLEYLQQQLCLWCRYSVLVNTQKVQEACHVGMVFTVFRHSPALPQTLLACLATECHRYAENREER